MPALLTATSSFPHASTTRRTIASTSAARVTSVWMASVRTPSVASSEAAVVAPSPLMSTQATSAPALGEGLGEGAAEATSGAGDEGRAASQAELVQDGHWCPPCR